MQVWDEIPKPEIQPWMDDFINVRVPNGESYLEMHERVVKRFEWIAAQSKPAIVVAHGGVLRSIVAHITNTPLKKSFDVSSFNYGCVVKVSMQENNFVHEILYN